MNISVIFNCVCKIGLTPHDLIILIACLETGWWLMFSLADGADALLKLTEYYEDNDEEHDFTIIQKYVSLARLILVIPLVWYGTILRGNAFPFRLYFGLGILGDIALILTLVVIGVEENWIYSPGYIVVVVQYILTFFVLRLFIYALMYYSMQEIFVAPFATPSIATVNGAVVGPPEQTNPAINSGNNLMFLGKGFKMMFMTYQNDPERACLLTLAWDVVWNLTIVFTQELPEILYDSVFIGLFGSLPIILPTEVIACRLIRCVLGCVGIYLVKKKIAYHIKLWLVASFSTIVLNIILTCVFFAMESDFTMLATFILCSTFFASNGIKFLILYCSVRFYVFLKRGDLPLINEDNNNTDDS